MFIDIVVTSAIYQHNGNMFASKILFFMFTRKINIYYQSYTDTALPVKVIFKPSKTLKTFIRYKRKFEFSCKLFSK